MTGQQRADDVMSEGATTYLVGARCAEITPPIGVPLGGYGARQGVSDRVAQPLRCTAVVVDDGATAVCLASCDLLYVTNDIRDAVRREVAARTGIPGEAVMLVATHTHSGPANLTADADPDYVGFLTGRIADAIHAAALSTEPATVRSSVAEMSGISLNRRDPGGPIERQVRTLIAESVADGRTIAVLMNYACHATVLEADSLAISPDFPGAAVAFVESATGATAGYLQGCAGAINPVWMDHTPDEVRRIGTVLGSVVVRQVLDGQGVERPRRSVNLSMMADVDTDHGPLAGRRLTGPLWHDAVTVRLDTRPARSTTEIDAEIAALAGSQDAADRPAGRSVDPPAGTAVTAVTARLATLQAERYLSRGGFRYWSGAPAVSAERGGADLPAAAHSGAEPAGATGSPPEEIELPAIGFGGSLALLGIPGEPFLEIGEEIRRASGLPEVTVCGYTNGTVGYLPTREAFADNGYEVGMARYTPEAADQIVEAGAMMLRRHAR